VTTKLYEALTAVQYGRVPDRHGWIHEVCPAETTETRQTVAKR
jgi:hypothetical protein